MFEDASAAVGADEHGYEDQGGHAFECTFGGALR